MDVGKLPPELLARLLASVPLSDPRVLLGPRFGEDAALIDMGGSLLVAKTDPITFATDLIGWYAVQINANDVACMGARPRWFMATVLLPQHATSELAENIFHQIVSACEEMDVSLIGGHSEITYELQRPIVVGHMLGEVARERVIRTGGASPGDAVVLTKGIAIEGTAVLAREAAESLNAAGVSQETLARARDYLFSPGISIVGEARVACGAADIRSMHDPTEGGLATGLWEMAVAAQVGLDIDGNQIAILPECRAVCAALGLDPMGLLASGALLITLPAEEAPSLVSALEESGTVAQVIGKVTPQAEGLKLRNSTGVRSFPSFSRDELARYLSQFS